MRWFDMPTFMLRALSRSMARLRAEESLSGATVAAVAAGTVEKNTGRELISAWRREASGGTTPAPMSRRDILARLTGMRGVQVIREPRSV